MATAGKKKYVKFTIDRPGRTLYLFGVTILATLWLGWPGLIISILPSIDLTWGKE